MLKKIKMVMMMMLVLGMTILMSSAGCDNVAGGSSSISNSGDSGSSGSGGSGRVQTLESPNGSTITFTYDDPKEISTGSFTFKLVDADKDESFTFSTGSGTYTFVKSVTGNTLGNFSFLVESPSDIEISKKSLGLYRDTEGVTIIRDVTLAFSQGYKSKRVEFLYRW